MSITSEPGSMPDDRTDRRFDLLADAVRSHFASTIAQYGPHLFTVDAGDLAAIYLAALPEHARQQHTCNACRSFFNRYGNLVAITENGDTIPAMWPMHGGAGLYDDAVAALRRAVSSAKVTGVFVSSASVWGQPLTGEWTHLAVSPSTLMFRHPLMNAGQAMAEKREHFGTLSRALAEFPQALVGQALTFLEAETLYRGEKVIGPARFLHQLQDAQARVQSKDRTGAKRRNLVWRAVAGAPAGFCTPRSSMIGTLLEDMAAGLAFEDVKAKFAAKMHPLQYQRPQTPASAGNIAQAEKIVAQMGLEASLRRRFARLDEVETLWKPSPTPAATEAGGVFGHLQAKGSANERIATAQEPVKITWAKFSAQVLPGALEMDLFTERSMSFGALVTAVDPAAPPLFQWDREDARNPVSWYLYHGGSAPHRWHLDSNAWVRVTGIALRPNAWSGAKVDHHGNGAILLLAGARDTDCRELALFPETLRAELHAVRKTIEQFSKSRRIEGEEDASACGLILGTENPRHRLRVRSATGVATYHIDRWD
jgi:hypothetical protein